MHRFGTEISDNRRPGAEFLSETRVVIISAREYGVSPSKIASNYGVARSTIYKMLSAFNNTILQN